MKLKELSNLLGLSQTTVSRALNGYPEVSEATRKRVRAVADAQGYHANIPARALATGRSMAIGHVIPVGSKNEMMNPIFGDFIAGAGEIYAQNGYDMLISIVSDEEQEAAYRTFHTKRSVDGIIVHAPRLNDSRINLLNQIGIPYVVHGRASGCKAPYPWVDVNNMQAFLRATDFLLDLGHRRIALVNGLETMDFAQRRRAGFLEAQMRRGLKADPALMFSGEMTESNGYEVARSMLATAQAPTAFLVSSMITAIGVRRAIEGAGLSMGRDVSVITHDDVLSYFRNGGDIPMFTATRSSVREAGKLSAHMLLALIAKPTSDKTNLLLEVELTLGQSTGPALMVRP